MYDFQNSTQQKQDAPQQLSNDLLKSIMPEVNIKTLYLTGQQVLIFHEDQNGEEDEFELPTGILLTTKQTMALKQAKLGMLTVGIIVATGPNITNKEITPGKTALFFRNVSEGGIKGTDGKIYVLFNEYNIRGILLAEKE